MYLTTCFYGSSNLTAYILMHQIIKNIWPNNLSKSLFSQNVNSLFFGYDKYLLFIDFSVILIRSHLSILNLVMKQTRGRACYMEYQHIFLTWLCLLRIFLFRLFMAQIPRSFKYQNKKKTSSIVNEIIKNIACLM